MIAVRFIHVFVFLFAFQSRTRAIFTVSNAVDIIKLTKEVVIALAKVWDLVDQDVDFKDLPTAFIGKKENELLGKIEKINSELKDQETRLNYVGKK